MALPLATRGMPAWFSKSSHNGLEITTNQKEWRLESCGTLVFGNGAILARRNNFQGDSVTLTPARSVLQCVSGVRNEGCRSGKKRDGREA
jgi:hypothetical protein